MSKYEALWNEIGRHSEKELVLSFESIEKILGFPIDHSFLTYKKELIQHGYQVEKISMKEKWVKCVRIESE